MKKNIIIILGEPNSIASEIFFKSSNFIKKSKLNFIIIGNHSLLKKQAKYLGIKIDIKFNFCKPNNINNNKKINFINIHYNQKKLLISKIRNLMYLLKIVLNVRFIYLKKN